MNQNNDFMNAVAIQIAKNGGHTHRLTQIHGPARPYRAVKIQGEDVAVGKNHDRLLGRIAVELPHGRLQGTFKSQIGLIQKSGIVTAMVGMLMAPPETRLWHRLNKENRLLPGGTGDNTDGTTNFIPKMGLDVLINGYKQILHAIYTPKNYYNRIHTFLKEYRPNEKVAHKFKFEAYHFMVLIKSTLVLGIKDGARLHYWKLILSTLLKYPKLIGLSVTLAVQGFHFRKVYEKIKRIEVDEALLERTLKVLDGEPA